MRRGRYEGEEGGGGGVISIFFFFTKWRRPNLFGSKPTEGGRNIFRQGKNNPRLLLLKLTFVFVNERAKSPGEGDATIYRLYGYG